MSLLAASCVKAVAPHAEPEKLAIIDGHGHLNGDMPPKRLSPSWTGLESAAWF